MHSYFSAAARTDSPPTRNYPAGLWAQTRFQVNAKDSLALGALATPPSSESPSVSEEPPRPSGYASVSTAFNPDTRFPPPNDRPPDLLVHSIPDAVLFHVHKTVLLATFNDEFARLMEQFTELDEPIISLHEPATIINCLLHIVYDMSCRQYAPSLDIISQSFTTLAKFGCPLPKIVFPASNIFQHLLHLAQSDPLDVYTIAAANKLENLAVSVSPIALSVPLTKIDETAATAMGPTFLLRLISLHTNRKDAMKQLLLLPPNGHDDTPNCNAEQQGSVMRAYSLAVAYLAWEPIVSADSSWISGVLSPLLPHIRCPLCEHNMRTRIHAVLAGWDRLKCTI